VGQAGVRPEETGPGDGASRAARRLESTKAPITVIVIESSARPSSDPGTEVTLPFVWQFLNDGYRVIFKLPANFVEAVVHVASNQSSIGNEQAGEARNKHHDSHSDN